MKSDFKSGLAGAEQSRTCRAASVKYRFGRYSSWLSRLAVTSAAAGRTAGSARPTARITWTLAGARTRARTAAAGTATGRALTCSGAGDAALACISARSALAHDSLLKMAAIWP